MYGSEWSHSGTLMYGSEGSHSGTLMYGSERSHSGTLMYCSQGVVTPIVRVGPFATGVKILDRRKSVLTA